MIDLRKYATKCAASLGVRLNKDYSAVKDGISGTVSYLLDGEIVFMIADGEKCASKFNDRADAYNVIMKCVAEMDLVNKISKLFAGAEAYDIPDPSIYTFIEDEPESLADAGNVIAMIKGMKND